MDYGLKAVALSASGLIVDGLSDLLGKSDVNRQVTSVGPGIQIRPMCHEQRRYIPMTIIRSIVEGSPPADVAGLAALGPCPQEVLGHIYVTAPGRIV